MQIQLNTGNTGPSANGSSPNLRGDRQNSLIVTELRGRYSENTRLGFRYQGANQTPVTTTVAFATTYTGLVLANPIGSTVNLELDKVGIATLVAFAAASTIGLMVGFNGGTALSATTADGLANANPQLPVGQGIIYKAATLPTAPTLRKVLASGLTGAITTAVNIPLEFDLEGSIVIPPGGYVALYTSTASGASGIQASFEWAEVPI